MRICLAQVNPTVGDVDGNAALVLDVARRAADAGADLVVLPEQVISGYPAEDLWLKPHFVARCRAALDDIAGDLPPIAVVVGCPHDDGDGALANAAHVFVDGALVATYRKQHLPNYAVFDEHRWFTAGDGSCVVDVPVRDGDGSSVPVGITICEDAWVEDGPVVRAADAGARLVVNLSASPWRMRREGDRERVVAARAAEAGCPVALCNLVGGQDELVFDGASLVVLPDGTRLAHGASFVEELVFADLPWSGPAPEARPALDDEELVWEALRLGLGDYVRKNGFASVVLGMSGGIDSALVAALAVDALGADRVHAATMPSRYSSEGTRGDAHAQAERLGIAISELAIEPVYEAFEQVLAPEFAGREADVAEENLQARIRGTLLMALSNKFGHLVLATGNKSEYAVGYATLYGDMNGGFAPLKDVPKTLVYRLARWRNERARAAGEEPVVPPSVIERAPSAELRHDQRDSDSLPDYDVLDALLERLVDHDEGVDEAVAAGFDRALAERVQRMLDRAEYKRRQAAPGVRVSGIAFGRDRRVPITNAFDGQRRDATGSRRPLATDA
jgi:NAD+ synthase (glutamine-hydrolysing)